MLIGLIVIGAIGVILWPLVYFDTKAEIREFLAVELTIKTARANQAISAVELAAIQQKAVEANQWLARMSYWDKALIGFMIPNEIRRLKPIF